MATDNLSQLGRNLKNTKDNIKYVTRRVAENFPLVETLRDTVGILLPYKLEFYTFKNTRNQVNLTINIQEQFKTDAVTDLSLMPLTITQTGISVGLPGTVGIQNVWYPLVALRDLNFLASSSYKVVFDISTYGTGSYFHKIVFEDGGVDLTSVTTITGSQITVNITQANVISPPKTTMYDAYIYGLVSGFSAAGWLHYSAATIFDMYNIVYTPRIIGA